MPTRLTPEQHLDGLRAAMVGFVRYADRAGLSAPVPTCPEWTVLDLVAHQGMVHRWAAAIVRGERPADDEVAAFERAAHESDDAMTWLRDGAVEVTQAVGDAPAGREALVFLNDAPAPRASGPAGSATRRPSMRSTRWPRRSAAPPRSEETWIDPELARDGIDELLGGFLTRPRSRLRCEEDGLLAVVPDDADEWWEVSLGPRPAVVTRHLAPTTGTATRTPTPTGSSPARRSSCT